MNARSAWSQAVLESLEPRLLLDAALLHGVWRIWGEDDPAGPADRIILRHSPDEPTVLQALVNGEVVDSRAVADVRAIKVFAGLGDDVVRVELDGAIPVWVMGGPGDDDITGAGGGDVLRGGRGADRLDGGDGDDRLLGGRGNDVLYGGAGDDRLRGGWGHDRLRGQGGADRLFGGRGRNWLYCLPSIDRLHRRPRDVMIVDAELPIPGDDQLGLAPADSADELMQWLIEAAVEANRELFGKPLQGPDGWVFPRPIGGGFVGFRGDLAVYQAGLADQAAPDHSGTNVQEAGVDEADLVKTDGEYIYLLDGGELVIVDAWPADELSVVSRTELQGTPLSMYLYGDRLAVLSYTWTRWDLWGQQGRALAAEGAMRPLGGPSLGLPVYCKPELIFTVLDVSDRGAPGILEQTSLDGTLVASRAIDGRVYLVVRGRGLDIWPVPVRDAQTGQWAYESEAQFRQRLARELPERLPDYATVGPDGQVVQDGLLVELPHVYVPGDVSRGPSLFVINFDITDEKVGPDGSTGVVGLDGAVYASRESLYIVAGQWSPPMGGVWDGGPISTIYKFELDGSEVPLVAKGAVPGTVLNQFSMDEEDGYFRIATLTRTDGVNASNVFVLGQNGKGLEVVGSITGLALGERIRSVRFLDDKGFVVTFRRVDPLFALDLSDPFEPLLAGELKVPGFSTYLHPVGADHLIGIGRDATLDGRVRGLKLSLFDVADLTEPVQTDVYLLSAGRGWSFSPAERDHHAFSYFPAQGVLAVPVRRMGPEGGWSLEVFKVDLENGFTHLGGVAHEGPVRRSLRIGEYLYSISTDAVKVHQVDDPTSQVGQVDLGASGLGV